MVSTSPSSSTDKGCQWEHFRGVFVFQHGLLGRTWNVVASSTAPSYNVGPLFHTSDSALSRRRDDSDCFLCCLHEVTLFNWLVEMLLRKQALEYILNRY